MNEKLFFDAVRNSVFGGSLSQSSVSNMNVILAYWREGYPANPANQLAYVLATVKAEVGRAMKPVREGFTKSDAAARHKVRNRAYGKPAGDYGHVYYGRGYVQLTWLSNYDFQRKKLRLDLVRNPDLALETEHAVRILVEGMMDGDFNGRGHGLPYYVNETKQDFIGARRTVNVQDRANEIARNAGKFLKALNDAGWGTEPEPDEPDNPITHDEVMDAAEQPTEELVRAMKITALALAVQEGWGVTAPGTQSFSTAEVSIMEDRDGMKDEYTEPAPMPEGKVWSKSKRVWGILGVAASVLAPVFGIDLGEHEINGVATAVTNITRDLSALLVIIGAIDAKGPIKWR